VVPLLALVGVSSCADPTPAGDAAAGRPRVVASFYALAYAAERVGGSAVEVINLTSPGIEPHDLELTADHLEAIGAADVVVYLGAGFQPAMEDAIGNSSGVVLDVLGSIATLPSPGDANGAEGGDHDDGTDEPSADPHVWLDPIVYARVAGSLASTLSQVDAANAATYAANVGAFTDELSGLDGRFREGLATCDSRLMVVSHAAFGYLARAYDLQQESITGVSPEAEPDPARLAELRRIVVDGGVTTVFTEELVAPDVAETLASEAGVTTAVLSPIESLTDEQVVAGDAYGSVMDANLEVLRDGLGCR